MSTLGAEKTEDCEQETGFSIFMIEFHTKSVIINNNQNRHHASDHRLVLLTRRFASIIHQPYRRMLPDHYVLGKQKKEMGMQDTTFRENVVIITGASFGIGQHLALQLAEKGAWLALAARSQEKLNAVSELCAKLGGRVVAIPADVAEPALCQHLIERAVQEYGRIDTLINNAGIGMASRFDELQDLTVFEKVFRVNFFGAVYCTHYALPYLKETRGRIVGVASQRAKFPSATADAYTPSKHAMVGFFDSLRIELADSGVSVTMIYPSWVSTGISTRALQRDGGQTGTLSKHEKNAMPVEVCARRILKVVAKRQREDIMTFQGKAGLWLKLIAPKLVDEIARQSTE